MFDTEEDFLMLSCLITVGAVLRGAEDSSYREGGHAPACTDTSICAACPSWAPT